MASATPAVAAAAAGGPLWSEPRFAAMLAAYRQKLPGKQRALRFSMGSESANLEVQDTAKPENVDAYDYQHGALSGPSPVNLSVEVDDGSLDDNLFDWDKVAVERIPALVEEAVSRTKLEGGQVVQVKIARKMPSARDISRRAAHPVRGRKGGLMLPLDEVEISLALQGSRHLGWLTADASGKVTGAGVN